MGEYSPGTNVISGACSSEASGATIDLLPGIYRQEATCNPKANQTIRKKPGEVGDIEILGSKNITGLTWTQSGAGWWAPVTGLTQRLNGVRASTGLPAVDGAGNNDSHEVFYDGVRSRWVNGSASLAPGKFWIDWAASPARVWVGDNPASGTVELSWVGACFFAQSGASGVTLQDLEIKWCANNAGSGGGAIEMRANGTNWTIRRCNVHHNHGRGTSLGTGVGVYGSNFDFNGQMGMGGEPIDGEIGSDSSTGIRTSCSHNNDLAFEVGWEAGGAKFGATTGCHVHNSRFEWNDGVGLWFDVNCRFNVIEDNQMWDNSHGGFFYEISYDAIVRRNDCRRNGYAAETSTGVGYASDLHIAHSGSSDTSFSVPQSWIDAWGGENIPGAPVNRGIRVEYNVIETYNETRGSTDSAINSGNGNGIALTQQQRLDSLPGFGDHFLQDVWVRGNKQIIRGNANTGTWWNGAGAHDPYTSGANIIWEDNIYEANPAVTHWRWSNAYRNFSYWQGTAAKDAGMTATVPETGLGLPIYRLVGGQWQLVCLLRKVGGAFSEIAKIRRKDAGTFEPPGA